MPDTIEIKPGIFITRQQQLELRRQCFAALRSGEFRQRSGQLECNGGNCCLGVFSRVFDRMFPGVLDICKSSHSATFDRRIGLLPEVVRKAIGLVDCWGGYDGGSLAGMNDRGVPFLKIADIIESNPRGLWVDERQEAA